MKILSYPKAPYIRRVGSIKIEGAELFKILKENRFPAVQEIEIKNKRYKFESIECAESNLELLLDKPTFKFQLNDNSFKLHFNEGAILRLEEAASDEDLVIFEKIAAQLEYYRTPFYFFGKNTLTFIFVCLLLLTLLHGHLFTEVADIYSNNHTYIIIKRVMTGISLFGIYVSLNLNGLQVVLKDKKDLLDNIHDKAISNLVIFLAGVAFYWMFTKLGVRP